MERSRLHTRSFGERFTWGSYREWKVNVFNAKESLYIANIQFLMVGAPKQQKKTTKTKKPKNEMNTKKNMITHKHRIQKSTLILFECWKKLLGQQRCCFFGQCCFCRFSFFFLVPLPLYACSFGSYVREHTSQTYSAQHDTHFQYKNGRLQKKTHINYACSLSRVQ